MRCLHWVLIVGTRLGTDVGLRHAVAILGTSVIRFGEAMRTFIAQPIYGDSMNTDDSVYCAQTN